MPRPGYGLGLIATSSYLTPGGDDKVIMIQPGGSGSSSDPPTDLKKLAYWNRRRHIVEAFNNYTAH